MLESSLSHGGFKTKPWWIRDRFMLESRSTYMMESRPSYCWNRAQNIAWTKRYLAARSELKASIVNRQEHRN